MQEKILETLKKCTRDAESFQVIEELVKSLEDEAGRYREEAEKYKTWLNLLERAIRDDYDSIVITNLDLEEPGPEIAYVNEGFTRMTGYEREEAVGKTPRILQGEKTDQTVVDKLKQRLENGESFFGHAVNYRKDGSEFVNQWDIHPLTDDEGHVTHWVSYQHDITEKKVSEKAWDDTRIEFDNLDEEIRSTKVDLDEQGNIVKANNLFRKLVRYDAEEIDELPFWNLLAEEDRENFRKHLDNLLSEDFTDEEYDLVLITKSGQQVEVKAKPRLISSNGQKILRLVFSNRSLQKRIIEMLQKRQRRDDRILDKL